MSPSMKLYPFFIPLLSIAAFVQCRPNCSTNFICVAIEESSRVTENRFTREKDVAIDMTFKVFKATNGSTFAAIFFNRDAVVATGFTEYRWDVYLRKVEGHTSETEIATWIPVCKGVMIC